MGFRIFGMTALMLLCGLAMPKNANAQLHVRSCDSLGWTPEQLVNNILTGSGVNVSNVRFNGGSNVITGHAIGTFTTGSTATNLGIREGIVISTGNVGDAVGPDSGVDYPRTSSTNVSNYNDASMRRLVGTSYNLYDCSVLEFDFTPRSDTVQFHFVFASEEYPSFVCSPYSDVFGFFLTSNDASDPVRYNDSNIALVPGTNNPIGIQTINGGVRNGWSSCILTNTQYYVDNTNGQTIEFNGFTTVLTAKAHVTPCKSYHIKIGITNVDDVFSNSAVFLEAQSLTSYQLSEPQYAQRLSESCCTEIVLGLTDPNSTLRTVSLEASPSSTAVRGSDYTLQQQVSFPLNKDTVHVPFCALLDGVSEGTERAVIRYSIVGSCAGIDADSITIEIDNTDPLQVSIGRTENVGANTATLTANITGGVTGKVITWYDPYTTVSSQTGATITVPLLPVRRVAVCVSDDCGNHACDTITVGHYDCLHTVSGNAAICAGEGSTFSVACADSCVWYAGSLTSTPIEVRQTSITVNPQTTTTYIVKAYKTTYGRRFESIDTVTLTVHAVPHLIVSTTPGLDDRNTYNLCNEDSARITWSGADIYRYYAINGAGTDTLTRHGWDAAATSCTFLPTQSLNYGGAATSLFVVMGHTSDHVCGDTVRVQISTYSRPHVTVSGNGNVCPNSSATLTVTGSTGNWGSWYFEWNGDDTTTAPSNRIATRTIPTTDSSFDYVVRTFNRNKLCPGSDTFHVVIYNPEFTLTADTTQICAGGTITLTTHSDSVLEYRYGGSGSWTTQNTHSYTLSSDGQTTLTVYGRTRGTVCNDTNSVAVTVWPIPTPTINPDSIAICNGQSTQLTATGRPDVSYYYRWSNRSGQWYTNENTSPNYTTAALTTPGQDTTVYTYLLYSWDASHHCMGVDSAHVYVHPIPDVQIHARRYVCYGDTVMLTATGATTYSLGDENNFSETNTWQQTITETTRFTVYGHDNRGLCTGVDTFTVVMIPLPVVTINGRDSISTAYICEGETKTLTADGAQTYRWADNASTQPSRVVAPPSHQMYTVTGYTVTHGLQCCDTAKVNVIVRTPSPVALHAPTTSICNGQSVTLTASNHDGLSTVVYSWGDTNNFGSQTQQTISPVNNAPIGSCVDSTYTYRIYGRNDDGTCMNSATITITVHQLPLPSLTPDVYATCHHGSVNFSFNAQGCTPFTYSFNNTNNFTSTATRTLTNLDAPATTTYTLYARDVNGCENSDTATIRVYTYPANLQLSVSNANVCSGTMVTFTATGAQLYSWDGGNSYVTANTYDFVVTRDTMFTVYGANEDTLCHTTSSVMVHAYVAPSLTSTVSAPVICRGESTTITVGGSDRYKFGPNGTYSTTNHWTVYPLRDTVYTIYGSAQGAECPSNVPVEIRVKQLPTITITPSPDTVCVGGSTTLTAAGANLYSFTGSAPFSATNTHSVTPSQVGANSYSVTGQDTTYGVTCVGNGNVTVTALRYPTITITPSSNAFCRDSCVTLRASGADVYSWVNNSSYRAGNEEYRDCPTATTTYTVYGRWANGMCENDTNINITVYQPTAVTVVSDRPTYGENDSAVLTATAAGCQFSWDGGAYSNSNTYVTGPLSDGDHTFTVCARNANGCISCTTITVTAYAIAEATLHASDTSICRGQSVTLNASGAIYYSWNRGTTYAQTPTSLTITPAADTTVILFGCDDRDHPEYYTADTVHITVTQIPSFTLSPQTTTVCRNQQVTLTASPARADYEYGFDTSAFTPSATYSFTAVSSGTVPVVCRSAVNHNCSTSRSATVTVLDLPTVSLTSNYTDICNGQSVTLNASGASRYSWNGGPMTTASRRSFSPTTTTTYTIEGEVTGGAVCSATASVTVTVHDYPVLVTSPDTSICIGDTACLRVSSSAGTLYSWNGGNPGTTSTYCVAPITRRSYTLRATDADGMCAVNHSFNVNVNQLPTVTLSCPGTAGINNPVVLTAGGAATYSWDDGVTFAAASTNNTTYNEPGDHQFCVVGRDNNGCQNSACCTTRFFDVPSTLTVTAQHDTVCNGDVDSAYVSGATYYQWSTDGVNFQPSTPSANMTSIGIVVTRDTTLYVRGYNQTSNLQFYSQASVRIGVKEYPVITMTSSTPNNEICRGDRTYITLSGADLWKFERYPEATNNRYPAFPQTTTRYPVQGRYNNSNCITKDTITIIVNPLPSVSMTITPDSMCVGDTVTLAATSPTAVSYEWNDSVTGASRLASPLATTLYRVTAIDANGCRKSDTSTVRVFNYHPVTLTPSRQAFCHDSTITLTATSDAGAWFRWMDDTVGLVQYNTVQRTPASSTNYFVETANSNGMCVTSAQTHVTVYPNPYVRAQVTTGSNICYGDRVRLSAAGDAVARWYSWGDTNNYMTQRRAFDTVPAGNTGHWAYITLYGKSLYGCKSSSTDSVWVNSIPTIHIEGDTNICQGDSTLFVATGAMQYSWGNRLAFNGTRDSSLINDSIVKPIFSDTTIVCYGANESSRCYSSASIRVNMFTYASLTARATTNEICEGDSVCITLSGARSYSYDDNDRTHFNNVTRYCFAPIDTTVYHFYGLAENGRCVSNAAVNINVTRLPRLSISASVTDACVGDIFSARIYGADQYSWEGSYYRSNPLFYDSVTTTKNSYVVGGRRLTNAGYCYNYDTLTIRRWTYPDIVLSSSRDTICAGDSITLTATAADSTTWYSWELDSNYNRINNRDTALTRSGYVSVLVVNYADSLFMCARRDSIRIHVHSLPRVSIEGGHEQEICKYSDISLRARGAVEYSWGDTLYYSTTQNIMQDMPPVTRTYIVYGRDENWCVGYDTCRVIVHNYPASLYLTASRYDICHGDTVQIFGHGATRYSWTPQNSSSWRADTAFVRSYEADTMVMLYGATDSIGCYDSAEVMIRVHEYPNTHATADRTIYCSGDTAVITVTGATEYSIDDSLYVRTNVFRVVVTADTDIVAYGRDNIGLCVKPDTVHVDVQQLPVLTLSASPDSICIGSYSQITAAGTDRYSWDGGHTFDTVNTSNVRPDDTTVYVIYGETDFSRITCRTSAEIKVYVFPYPEVSIITEVPAGCQYEPLRFGYSGNADSISWLTPGHYVPVYGNHDTTYAALGLDTTGWVYVYGKYTGGICPAKDSVYITVYPAPTTTATITSDTVCAGDTVVLNLSGAEYYSVSGDAFGYNTTHILIPDSTQTYIIVGENFSDGHRCRTNDTLTITVMQYPQLRLNADTFNICYGDVVTFTAGNADILSWEGGEWIQGQTFATQEQPQATHVYTIAGANANGMCVAKDSIKIQVHRLPVMVLHPDRPSICRGDHLRLTVEDDGCVIYSWDSLATYTVNHFRDTMPRRGNVATFRAYGIDAFGCISFADTVVTISDVPPVQLVASDTAICAGSSITLSASGSKLYSWDDGVYFDTTNRITVQPPHDTVYTVYGASDNLLCRSKAAVRISVYDYPYATIEGPSKFCQGDTLELYVNTNATSVYWSAEPGDRQLNNGRQYYNRTIRLQFMDTTTYTVEAYLHICTTTVSHKVIMVPYPKLHIAASTRELCVGGTSPDGTVTPAGTVTVEATGANLYSWDGGNTQVPDTSHTYTPTLPSPDEFYPDSVFVYWFYSYSDDTLCRTGDSIHVRVDQWPALTICQGSEYQGIACDSSCIGRGRYLDGYTFAPVTWTATPRDETLEGQEHSYRPHVDPRDNTDYLVSTTNGTCHNHYLYSIKAGVLPSSFGVCDPAQIRRGTNGVTYRNLSTNAVGVHWYFADGYYSQAIDRINYVVPAEAVDSFPVTLIAYNGGCFDTSVIRVDIVNDEVWAPNAFTPDEAVNNIFYVRSIHNANFHMEIYSRNGVMVFSSDDPEQGWDGKYKGHKCPQGTYVYIIKTEPDNHTGKDHYVKGTVTLLR